MNEQVKPTEAQEFAAMALIERAGRECNAEVRMVAALLAERDAARAERDEAVKLLRRADDCCQMLKPPTSDCYTNGLEADIQQFLAAPPGPEHVKEKA